MSDWMRDQILGDPRDAIPCKTPKMVEEHTRNKRNFQDVMACNGEMPVNIAKLRQLEKDFVDLKCCGNCKHYDDTLCHYKGVRLTNAGQRCDNWKSDEMNYGERWRIL